MNQDCKKYIDNEIKKCSVLLKQELENSVDKVESSLVDNLSSYIDEFLDELVAKKIFEKIFNIKHNVDAICQSMDDEEIVKKYCNIFLKNNRRISGE